MSNLVEVTEDLKPILSVLTEEDAQQILVLKDELADNWNKKQIFRTETEMRVSVLNDVKHPTAASKYWQSVREMGAHFDALMGLSFELRRNQVRRLKLEKKMQRAIDQGNELKQRELQIDLDENLYTQAQMEQVAHDRVRELKTWSKIKSELDDNSFDTQNVNTHQALSLKEYFENRVRAITPHSDSSEILNAYGLHQTAERLVTKDGKVQSYKEAPALEEYYNKKIEGAISNTKSLE